jgi:membrane associated rhomboid family serine protease
MSDRPPHTEAPVHPLPPVVVGLFLVLLGVEGVLSLGEAGLLGGAEAVGWRSAFVVRFGFSGTAFDWMIDNGRWPAEHLVRFVSYPFLHGSFYHALFAMVILLAMGKIVGEGLGTGAFLLIFFASAVTGALAFGLLSDGAWLVGAYPPVYGMIGGFTYLLWLRLGQFGAPQYRAFSLIGVLLLVQLVFSVLFGGGTMWIADVAGFCTGFLLAALMVPGGWARLLDKMRGR